MMTPCGEVSPAEMESKDAPASIRCMHKSVRHLWFVRIHNHSDRSTTGAPFAIIKWCTRKEHRKNCVARPTCHHDSNDMRVLNKAVIPKSLNESFKDESP